MSYEIDDCDGRCLYRGDDLGLACEIHDQNPTARLVMLPAPVQRRASADTGCTLGRAASADDRAMV
jgi:hypothetical protein